VDELLGPGMDGYQILLRELKARIRMARLQAALAVNEELILLYWGIGCEILERKARVGIPRDRPTFSRLATRFSGHDRVVCPEP
jgi:hypothetical protein